MSKSCIGIGKSGCMTSWKIKKSILKKLVGGSFDKCQSSMDTDIDNKSNTWLQLTKVLQNIRGKGIATMIGKIDSKNVIVKVQMGDEATKEIETQLRLEKQEGFIKYNCDFTCDGNKEYIEQFSTVNEQTKLCSTKGSNMKIIIMPYYENGALETIMKTIDKARIKRILVTIIKNYASAYRDLGFTHGDFFAKNIVLDHNMEPIIIDFEKSQFQDSYKRDKFWNDLDNLFLDVSCNVHIGNFLFDKARTLTLHRAYGTEPTTNVIADLVSSIENL